MKIEQIELSNFKNFSEVSINLNPDITYLVGPNGAGKSTLGLDAIWMILKGVGEKGNVLKGERKMFLKEGPTASGTMVLSDGVNKYTVKRSFTKDAQKLTITSDDGQTLGQEFLDSFFTSAMMAPMSFAQLSPKEQAQQLGIDTSDYDLKIKAFKLEHTILFRERAKFGEVEIPELVEDVDVSSLNAKKNKILQFNREQEGLKVERERLSDRIEQSALRIAALLDEIAKEEKNSKLFAETLISTPLPQSPISVADIDKELDEASATNAKAIVYRDAVRKAQEKEQADIALRKNEMAKKEVEEAKIGYIQAQKLPFPNIAVDDDGGLLLNGKPINERFFSTGQLLKAIPVLLASRNPEFKYCFIQYWNLLDEDKQQEVLDTLLPQGFQLVIEVVGKKMSDDSAIILSELLTNG